MTSSQDQEVTLQKTYQKHCPKTLGVRSGDVSEILATNHTFRFQNPRFSGDPACFFRRSCPGKLVGWQAIFNTPNQSHLTWSNPQPININLSTSPKKKKTWFCFTSHKTWNENPLQVLIPNKLLDFRPVPIPRKHPCVIRVPDWEFRNLQGSKKKSDPVG